MGWMACAFLNVAGETSDNPMPLIFPSFNKSALPSCSNTNAKPTTTKTGASSSPTSKGLVGVGLPRKGKTLTPNPSPSRRGEPDQNPPLPQGEGGRGVRVPGWEDVKDMTEGTVEVTITDDTQPGGPIQRAIVYQAPFEKCDRVTDYRIAWKFFEEQQPTA
jgi:hypothetical protein